MNFVIFLFKKSGILWNKYNFQRLLDTGSVEYINETSTTKYIYFYSLNQQNKCYEEGIIYVLVFLILLHVLCRDAFSSSE
jgi:hypothetical protein